MSTKIISWVNGGSATTIDIDFGIVAHGRPGARYEQLHGYNVDRNLLDLLLESRVPA